MVRKHHQLNGHEFEQTQGDSEGQGILACCSPWSPKQQQRHKIAMKIKWTCVLSTLKSTEHIASDT